MEAIKTFGTIKGSKETAEWLRRIASRFEYTGGIDPENHAARIEFFGMENGMRHPGSSKRAIRYFIILDTQETIRPPHITAVPIEDLYRQYQDCERRACMLMEMVGTIQHEIDRREIAWEKAKAKAIADGKPLDVTPAK